MAEIDDRRARLARLERSLPKPVQVRTADGKFVQYQPPSEVLKAIEYERAEIARLETLPVTEGGTAPPRRPRQVRVVYNGRGY